MKKWNIGNLWKKYKYVGLVVLAVFGADNMVIPAMVLTLIVLLAGRRKLCA